MRLIELMTTNPASIVALKDGRGTLAVGSVADVTVIDAGMKWTVNADRFASRSRNTPFHGWNLTGRPTHTIVGGEVKWRVA
jgi:dihydroorotase